MRFEARSRHTPKPPKPSVTIDEEAARAGPEMDAIYLRKCGKPLEKPKKDA